MKEMLLTDIGAKLNLLLTVYFSSKFQLLLLRSSEKKICIQKFLPHNWKLNNELISCK